MRIKIKTFLGKIMDLCAKGLGSRTAFVIFLIIAIVPLIFQFPGDLLNWTQYLSQCVIQLLSLSVLSRQNKKDNQKLLALLKEEITLNNKK